MLQATAAQINCVNGVNGDMPTEITREDVNNIITMLVHANAYTIMDNIEGEDRFGTAPIRDSYWAMANSQMIPSFEAVDGFIAKAQYPSQMNILPAEWGSISNMRYLVSSIGSVTPTSSAMGADVYNVFNTGLEAYCCIEQDGYSANFIYIPPMIAGGPLALNCSVGYKFAEAPVITNDTWIINQRATLA